MGPFQYKTICVDVGTWGSVAAAAVKIQKAIDDHVKEGWELYEYHPIPTAAAWKWNVLIFRKPSAAAGSQAETGA